MMYKFAVLFLFLSLSVFAAQADSSTSQCESLYQQHFKSDMELSYQAFDQTPQQGFRALAAECPQQAIELIKNYIILNNAQEDSLRWHLAQLLGEVGKTDEATKYALSTLRDKPGTLLWNEYVEGYVAHWQGDLEKLKTAITVLESATEHKGNAINAKFLKQFADTLEQSQQK
ncbi:hypothetical protein [Marinicella sp. W31]|uniref:hypothetical protein n=1 Tax=Marinicella sp. W31 TaxID=3023713 RepID=UPI0037564E9D